MSANRATKLVKTDSHQSYNDSISSPSTRLRRSPAVHS